MDKPQPVHHHVSYLRRTTLPAIGSLGELLPDFQDQPVMMWVGTWQMTSRGIVAKCYWESEQATKETIPSCGWLETVLKLSGHLR